MLCVTYNVGDGPDAAKVRDLDRLDAAGADVIGLQEVGDRGQLLARPGWRVLRAQGDKARDHVALLVRDTIGVKTWNAEQISPRTKVGKRVAGARKTGYAEPKWIAWADLDNGLTVGVTHLVPSTANPLNVAARALYRRQVAACAAWVRSGGDILLGDFNGSPTRGLIAELAKVADAYTRPSFGRGSIDHVWVRKGSGIDVRTTQAPEGYSSDHRPVMVNLSVPAAKPPPPAPPKPREVHDVTYRYLTNLADVARGAGLRVVEHPGWKTRGRPASTGGFDPSGVLVHHTATARTSSDAAVVRVLVNGRSDLPGPLAQLGLSRDGTVHVIAAGRANHAGKAKASGPMPAGDGNALYVGIEAFNDGVGEPWPKVQYDAYVRLCAALSKHVTLRDAATVRGHRETSVTGKVDPRFDMAQFRGRVEKALSDQPAPPKPEPAPKPTGVELFHRDLAALLAKWGKEIQPGRVAAHKMLGDIAAVAEKGPQK